MIAGWTRRSLCALSFAAATALVIVSGANAAAPPVKALFTSQFGYQVNLTQVNKGGGSELEDVCTVASKDECQPGSVNGIPGGLWGPESVAGAPNGNVYVADRQNDRVQEFTATGKFVLMFGNEVNETTHGNVCTATEVASGATCKAGAGGSAVGDVELPESIAVDAVSGDVYVAELLAGSGPLAERVQKFTPEGQFILEIGREVNEQTKGNVCTHEEEVKEAVKCVGPAAVPVPYTPEPGSFNFETSGAGNLLAVGPTGTLYVGDEGRVQELTPSGQSAGERSVQAGSRADAVAVDQSENLFIYTPSNGADIVHEFDKEGNELSSLTVAPEGSGAQVVAIRGFAVDVQGRLAVAVEQQTAIATTRFGALYEASAGRLLSRFKVPGNEIQGVGFNGNDELYASGGSDQDVLAYQLAVIPDLTNGSASCAPGGEHETDLVFSCTIEGEVNPEGVAGTQAWFDWGYTEALGEETAKQAVTTAEPLSAAITVRPNAPFYYQLAAENQNVKAPETIVGEPEKKYATPLVAVNIVGAPEAPFVHPSSAIVFAQLNPENASSEYFFEYSSNEEDLTKCSGGKQAACPNVARSGTLSSAVYGKVGATAEVTGLQPGTRYSYRLFAENENATKTERLSSVGEIGSFTTEPAPSPSAQTGGYGSVSATSAIVSGVVQPDGASVTYAFELGVYAGAETQYGVVASGATEPSTGSTPVSTTLTGLRPGTTYAYRVSISSGYIANEPHTLYGAPVTFTTEGIPAVLSAPTVLTQLSIPSVKFPVEVPGGKQPLTRAQKLAKALRACKHKPRRQRAACERNARNRYGAKAMSKRKTK